jgi:hypothetical protein
LRDELPSGKAKPVLSPTFENAVANSPVARLVSTARTLTDPRKWQATGGLVDAFPGQVAALNALSGLRVTDVPVRVQEGILRDAIADISKQKGAVKFETIRFTRDQIAQAEKSDPELATEMRSLNAAATELVNRAKARKKSAKQSKLKFAR